MSPEDLGWYPVIQALVASRRATDAEPHRRASSQSMPSHVAAALLGLYKSHAEETYGFLYTQCHPVLATSLVHIVTTSHHLLNPLIEDMGQGFGFEPGAVLQRLFWFCLSWAAGGLLEAFDRARFDQHVRPNVPDLPESDTIFEYRLDVQVCERWGLVVVVAVASSGVWTNMQRGSRGIVTSTYAICMRNRSAQPNSVCTVHTKRNALRHRLCLCSSGPDSRCHKYAISKHYEHAQLQIAALGVGGTGGMGVLLVVFAGLVEKN